MLPGSNGSNEFENSLSVMAIPAVKLVSGRLGRISWPANPLHPPGAATLGHQIGRYLSLERLIEQNEARYYKTLEQSSRQWRAGHHDPWPYINYILFVLKSAYRNWSSASATCTLRAVRKPNRCWRPSSVCHENLRWPNWNKPAPA